MRISNEALTFHLRVLLQTGIAHQRRRGRHRMYRLQPRALVSIVEWLRAYDPRR
jgi:DNA-binding transcriptional ArsR family regulator